MQDDKGNNKIPLANLDETLDRMFFGEETIREARINRALELRKFRRGGIKNKAK